MKYFVTLSDLAEIDLEETNSYYSRISDEVLQRFWFDLNLTMEKVAANPLLFQKRYQHTRIVFLENFPFGVHFIIVGEELEVLRILHTKREF